ncbi:MAG: hypothetical protein SGARI_005078 [Bacillariaceae sp.]
MADATTTTETAASVPKKHAVDLQEVQDTVSRLAACKGVLAVLILNKSGDIVTQSFGDGSEGASSVGNPKLLTKMLAAANTYVMSMQDDDEQEQSPAAAETTTEGVEELLEAAKDAPEENITFVRIRTPQNEILVAPKLGYTLAVLQDPIVSSL